MADVASRELRNETRRVLQRVEAGEEMFITVDGRRVAVLLPIGTQRTWLPRQDLVKRLAGRQADAMLSEELAQLAPDTTDDLS